MAARTISHCQGKGSLAHNNREFFTKNIDRDRTPDNITFKKESLKTAYEHCFGEAVRTYNQKQKRADRRIEDYYKHLFGVDYSKSVQTNSNKQNSFYEDLVQIGTMDDTAVGSEMADVVSQALSDYVNGFQERNPNFYLFNAVLHRDEATPHLHLDYIPLKHSGRGLSVQNGIAGALKEMGYGEGAEAINRWRESERKVLEEICAQYGIEIKAPEGSRGYSFTVEKYKEVKSLERKKEVLTQAVEDAKRDYDICIEPFKTKGALESIEPKMGLIRAKDVEKITRAHLILPDIQKELEATKTELQETKEALAQEQKEKSLLQKAYDELERRTSAFIGKLQGKIKALEERLRPKEESLEEVIENAGRSLLKEENERLQRENHKLRGENKALRKQLNQDSPEQDVFELQL